MAHRQMSDANFNSGGIILKLSLSRPGCESVYFVYVFVWFFDSKICTNKRKNKQKQKSNINYAKKRTCTATYVMKHSWRYVLRLKSFKPVVGTLIQYLHDGDTFIIRIQCSVLEVL